MEAFLISTGVVALAEVGDKTQILAFILAARYKKPLPIILGVLVATLLNHSIAGAIGEWIGVHFNEQTLRWLLGLSFMSMALWILVPDKFDEADAQRTRFGVFGTTVITFFMAEVGDKTQIATVALAAQYHSLMLVVMGTTLGMMIANVPAILLGERIADKVPVKLVHGIAAAIFALLGVAVLAGVGGGLTL